MQLKLQKSEKYSTSCWACGGTVSDDFEAGMEIEEVSSAHFKISDAHYGTTLALRKCTQCDFVWAPEASVAKISNFYQKLEDVDYVGSQNQRVMQLDWLLKKSLLFHPEAKSILDVGAATGILVNLARKHGLESDGVEPSHSLVSAAERLYGLKLFEGTLKNLSSNKRYDLIFLVDVIEHVPNPRALLMEAHAKLNPNGLIIVTTPDLKSISSQIMGKRWWHRRVAHIGYFDSNNFERMARTCNLEVAHRFRPLWFFNLGYLFLRIGKYFPLLKLSNSQFSSGLVAKLEKYIIPLNLFDSHTFILCPKPQSMHALQTTDNLKNKNLNTRINWKQFVSPYIQIARFDHWIKNIFVLPGLFLAGSVTSINIDWRFGASIILAFLAVGFIASSNYIINEIMDAASDRFHPIKYQRPIPSGKVNLKLAYIQWILFGLVGMGLSININANFAWTALFLWIMGCLYNISPIRTKDKLYLDVLSEAINNPIRMLLGWNIVAPNVMIPLSLIMSYWMIGCYLMNLKRQAEFKMFSNPIARGNYRRSFFFYTEKSLQLATLYYLATSMLFFGAFSIRYHLEVLLSYPLLAIVFTEYYSLLYENNSALQAPEKLYKKTRLLCFVLFTALVLVFTMHLDLPQLREFFEPRFPIK